MAEGPAGLKYKKRAEEAASNRHSPSKTGPKSKIVPISYSICGMGYCARLHRLN